LIYVSSVLFFAGSLIAALAGNFTVILIGRTIQGVGGGGLIALTEVSAQTGPLGSLPGPVTSRCFY
jgi:predicted MFS family arabinose efflux permease